jgi:hypothetical protein
MTDVHAHPIQPIALRLWLFRWLHQIALAPVNCVVPCGCSDPLHQLAVFNNDEAEFLMDDL